MTLDRQAILAAIKALPETEQQTLVEELLDMLGPPPDEMTEEEFAAELDRRVAEVQRGEVDLITWEEFKRRNFT